MHKIFATSIALLCCNSTIAAAFQLHSDDIHNGQFTNAQISDSFGCHGSNRSPQLSWTDPPTGTKSFVITMYDLDAPTGSGWWHWTVANIPATVRSLPTGAGNDTTILPSGAVQTNTDLGKPGYLGPCPPLGRTHHYRITIQALSTEKLEVGPATTAAQLGFMSGMVNLGTATLNVVMRR